MKNKLFFTAILLICTLICSAQKYGQNPGSPYQQQQPSSWQGTGWAINNGYIVTNHHVVDGARTLILKCMVGETVQQYTGEVAVMDEEHDLAIIRITDAGFKGFGRLPYMLKTDLAEVGESVFVLGYPMADILGDEIKLTTGVVSSRTGMQGNASSYQISAPVQPGNSGGPLFDEDGNVIGVVNAKARDAENVGYAIKAQYVKELISKLPSAQGVAPANKDLAGKKLPEQVKALKSHIFTIYASTQASGPSASAGNPRSGAPTIPQGNKVIDLPYVDYSPDMSYMRIERITITDSETIVEFKYSNRTQGGYYQWINIEKETYLRAGGQTFKMKSASGIAIAPQKTTFKGIVDNKTFKLIFPAIPKGITSFDLIEPGDGGWKFYGISTK